MPEYIGGKKVSDTYIGGKKVTKKYRGTNMFYSAYATIGTSVWSTTGNQVFVGAWNQSSKNLYTGVTYNHSNSVALTIPIEKIKNGLQFNFGSVSLLGTNSPFLPIFFNYSFGSYYYNTNGDNNVGWAMAGLVDGVNLPTSVQVTKADLISGNKIVLMDGNDYFVTGGRSASTPSIIYVQLKDTNLIFTSSEKTAEQSNDAAMIKAGSSSQMGVFEYEFPIFSSITAY